MQVGDLAVWTKYASEWSRGPEAGSLAGVVVRIIKPRRHSHKARRVELHADGGSFIVGEEYVEAISHDK